MKLLSKTLRRKQAHLLATEESLAVVGTLIDEVSDLYKDSDDPPDLTEVKVGYRALENHFAHLFRAYRRSLLADNLGIVAKQENAILEGMGGKKKPTKKPRRNSVRREE